MSVEVARGHGPVNGFFSSCDDLGAITITVARPDDDADTDADVGYRFELVRGSLPDGLVLPPGDETDPPWLGPVLTLLWADGATDEQDAFDFFILIHSVDVAGNVGDPALVQLTDDPEPRMTSHEECECAHGTGPGTAVTGLLVALVVGTANRGRDRRAREARCGAETIP